MATGCGASSLFAPGSLLLTGQPRTSITRPRSGAPTRRVTCDGMRSWARNSRRSSLTRTIGGSTWSGATIRGRRSKNRATRETRDERSRLAALSLLIDVSRLSSLVSLPFPPSPAEIDHVAESHPLQHRRADRGTGAALAMNGERRGVIHCRERAGQRAERVVGCTVEMAGAPFAQVANVDDESAVSLQS